MVVFQNIFQVALILPSYISCEINCHDNEIMAVGFTNGSVRGKDAVHNKVDAAALVGLWGIVMISSHSRNNITGTSLRRGSYVVAIFTGDWQCRISRKILLRSCNVWCVLVCCGSGYSQLL